MLLRNSNTFRKGGSVGLGLFKRFLGAAVIVLLVPLAQATDTDRAISHYIRDRWGSDNGFPASSVSAITQTTDGYLWIGTEKGLVRFDGLNFHLFEKATPSAVAIGPVEGLMADADGNLWILLQSTQILRYHNGKFELGREEAEFGITSVGKRRDGTILFSSLSLGTLAYHAGKYEVLSSSRLAPSQATATTEADTRSTRLSWAIGFTPQRFGEPNSPVTAMAETNDGRVWLGTRDKGLFCLSQGRVSPAWKGLPNDKINCLLPENNELWIGTDQGMVRWDGTQVTSSGVPTALSRVEVLSMLRDRNSDIWVGTSRGLVRMNSQGALVDQGSPQTNGKVTALFQGREGNIWVGGPGGMQRLHDSPFVTYSVADGLPSESNGAVFVDQEGRTWFAPLRGGLYWKKGPQVRSVTADGLDKDVVYSIAGRAEELWVGREHGGLTRLEVSDNSVNAKTYTQADGLAENSVYSVYLSHDGTVWAGTLRAGVSAFRNGRFTNYTTANGLASNAVTSIAENSGGGMWFATPNGLNNLSNGQWHVFTVQDGLPSADLNCLLTDSSGVLWIGSSAGIAFLRANQIQIPREVPEPLREPVLGIAEDRSGWLWIATSGHVLRVKRSRLWGGGSSDSEMHEYGLADGLLGTEGVKRQRSVFADPLGRIWFSMNRGLSVVDPNRTIGSSAPALVHIDAVLADGNAVDPQSPIRIPSASQRITFSYTGLSLTDTGHVRYRYRLDGFDRDWSEPSTLRTAVYTNLSPGSYKFHVIASNSEGMWNSAETILPFAVDPMWWQKLWVRLSALLAVAFVVFALYRSRLHRLARQYNIRMEERIAERTRIAQDLHDTLLQGVLSASMQLHVAVDSLPEDSPVRPKLKRTMELMAQVIQEGRDTLRGLRPSEDSGRDLENTFLEMPEELGHDSEINFRVIVQGESVPLRAAIHDEVYRIGREALVNAFRHSHANNIEVWLEYQVQQLRLLISDDGCGIDSNVLEFGREGHWGLSGMRSRAERIGAKLRVMSRRQAGTEVELCIPSRIAFVSQRTGGLSKWISRFFPTGKTAAQGTTGEHHR